MTVEAFTQLLEGVRQTYRGYQARCPAHGDRSPSLSIREAEDGRILLHCFAGCHARQVCDALGIRIQDLYPHAKGDPHQIRAAKLQRHRREQAKAQARRLDETRADLLREAERVIAAGSPIPIEEQSDRFMEALCNAHDAMRHEKGEQEYAEWSCRLGANYRPPGIG